MHFNSLDAALYLLPIIFVYWLRPNYFTISSPFCLTELILRLEISKYFFVYFVGVFIGQKQVLLL